MSKIARWKKIFGYAGKQKVLVKVSGRAEAMTATQSCRFEELTRARDTETFIADENPLQDSKDGLHD